MGLQQGLADLRANKYGGVLLGGTVTFGGSGAVASQNFVGATITKPAGTGVYRVTFDEMYNALVGAWLKLSTEGTPADVDVQLGTSVLASNVSFDFQTMSAGSAADATSGHICHILALVTNTDIGPSGA